MSIEVLFFGQLRELTEARRTDVEIKDSASLVDLMEYLVRVYGIAFRDTADSIQGLRILINGREYTILDGMETILKEGDTVVFLPPIAGG